MNTAATKTAATYAQQLTQGSKQPQNSQQQQPVVPPQQQAQPPPSAAAASLSTLPSTTGIQSQAQHQGAKGALPSSSHNNGRGGHRSHSNRGSHHGGNGRQHHNNHGQGGRGGVGGVVGSAGQTQPNGVYANGGPAPAASKTGQNSAPAAAAAPVAGTSAPPAPKSFAAALAANSKVQSQQPASSAPVTDKVTSEKDDTVAKVATPNSSGATSAGPSLNAAQPTPSPAASAATAEGKPLAPKSAWGEGGPIFKQNVISAAAPASSKIMFGSQPGITEPLSVPSVVETSSAPKSAIEASAASAAPFEPQGPVAPMPKHAAHQNFAPNIPRTVSAPPDLRKLMQGGKGPGVKHTGPGHGGQSGLTISPTQAASTDENIPTVAAPVPQAPQTQHQSQQQQAPLTPGFAHPTHQHNLSGVTSGVPQQQAQQAPHLAHPHLHQGIIPNALHAPQHGSHASSSAHPTPITHHHPMPHMQPYPSGPQPPPPQQQGQQPTQHYPNQGLPHQQFHHYQQQGRSSHIRPMPQQQPGMVPQNYHSKSSYKGPQYQQAPPPGTIPTMPPPPPMSQYPLQGFQMTHPYFMEYQPYFYPMPQYPGVVRPGPGTQQPIRPPFQSPVTPYQPSNPVVLPTPSKSKAIRIVNPNTKEDVQIPKPATTVVSLVAPATVTTPATSGAVRPEPVKEKVSVPVVLKDLNGNKIELKAPSKGIEELKSGTVVPADVSDLQKEDLISKEGQLKVSSGTEKGSKVDMVAEVPSSAAAAAVEAVIPKETTAAVIPPPEQSPARKASPASRGTSPVPTTSAVGRSRSVSPVKNPVVQKAVDDTAAVAAEVVPAFEEAKRATSPARSTAQIKTAEAPESAAVSAVSPTKPSILVSSTSGTNVDDGTEAVPPEVEDGEIVEADTTVTNSPLMAEPASEEPVKDARSTVSAQNAPTKPSKITYLTSFEGIKYPDDVSPPTKINNVIKYSKEFLMLFNGYTDKPASLPPLEFFSEESRPAARSSRMGSGSGSGYFSGASSAGSGQTAPKRPGQSSSNYTPVMRTVPAPSGSSRGSMPNRAPSTGPGSAFGSHSGRGSQGSYDGKGMPPRPGAVQHGRGSNYKSAVQEPVVELHKTENAWVPDAVAKRKGGAPSTASSSASADSGEPDLAVVGKKVQGLLNKLTIEKFDIISDQVMNLPFINPEILKKAIDLIFDKALDEPHFQAMYGRLCVKLSQSLPKVQQWIDMDQKNNVFRRLLLNKCQEEFEKNEKWSKSDQEGALSRKERMERLENMTSEEKEKFRDDMYMRSKLKRRVLGNIQFIAELFKLSMLTEKIMHSCINQLIQKVVDPEEEETESLCKLLKSVGERLDHEKARGHMDIYFNRIKELSHHLKLSSRIRFMLQDLIEQRKNKWKARTETVGPMSIAELEEREERKLREEEEARRRDMASGRAGGGRSSRGGGGGTGGRSDSYRQGSMGGGSLSRSGPQDVRAADPNGWNTVDRAKSARQVEDLVNFGKLDTQRHAGGQMHLGPQTNGSWSKGAGSGSVKEEPEKSNAKNIYSLLTADAERKKSTDSGDRTTVQVVSPVNEVAKLSPEQIQAKIDGSIAEWFQIFDTTEVIASHKELGSSEFNSMFLQSLIMKAFEKKADDVQKTAGLIAVMLKEGIFTSSEIHAWFEENMVMLDDFSVDVPEVFKYMGMVFARLVAADSTSFNSASLLKCLAPVIESKARQPPALIVLKEILVNLTKNESEGFAKKIYDSWSGNLRNLWPSASRSDEVFGQWLEASNLKFLDPSFKLTMDLKNRIGKESSSEILKWLLESVPVETRESSDFMRILTLTVLRHLGSKTLFVNGVENPQEISRDLFMKQEEILLSYKEVFIKLISENIEVTDTLEVEVLFACQAYWTETNKLKTFLEHLFRLFTSKAKIVTGDAVVSWKKDTVREAASKKAAMDDVAGWMKSQSF